MKIFYISKYACTPEFGNPTRQFKLSKYMGDSNNKVTLIYSRSNGDKHPFFFGLFKKNVINKVDCINLNGPILKEMGFSLKRIFSWLLFELNLFFFFLFLSPKKRPDVVIASSLSLLTFYTVSILKKIYKFQMIVEVRDIWPLTLLESGEYKENDITIKFLKWIELVGYRNADKIISTLPQFDKYLKTENVFNKPFKCINQGFDSQLDDNTLEIQTNNKTKNFRVVYAGSIGNLDFVNELCESAEILKNEKIEFIVYGKGSQKETLQQTYNHLSSLSFKGYINRDKIVSELIKNADLVVNMWGDRRIYDYGISPNKWMDYMLAAKPILVSYNGYQSIINEAHCGWFIEANNPERMAEKILEISKMPSGELDRIGMNGREYALKHHDYKVLAKELLEFLENG